eukprot:jgi/Botrbrau1/2616/Bobra.145_1s0036.1
MDRTAFNGTEALPGGTQLSLWQAPIFANEPFQPNWREFRKQRGSQLQPLDPPATLPALATGLDVGDLPDLETLNREVASADASGLHPRVADVASNVVEDWRVKATRLTQRVAEGGEPMALCTLRNYLQAYSFSGNGEPDPALAGLVREATEATETPATPKGSFPALFSLALLLGTLSRRRAYAEARATLDQNPLAGLGLGGQAALPAQATEAATEAADFHWRLAFEDRGRAAVCGGSPRHWRWRGFMTDYYIAGPEECGVEEREDAPAVLLVHGFGAFGEQWRGQLRPLARSGYRVYAPTFPGYGRSEKPALPYGQNLWRDFLRDFIVEVVRRPVVAVGNSIGGYISASLAADYSNLVQGLVLVNTAGQIREDYVAEMAPALPQAGPPGFVADLVSRGLFLYLERSIAPTLTKIYAVDPANADEWLAEEIFRAACDPGALGVFRSVFYLPKPRPLNYLVSQLYRGPTLVLQGARDPLNDAVGRANLICGCCPNAQLRLLEAGHCPHDERPDLFNTELLSFVETCFQPAKALVSIAAE